MPWLRAAAARVGVGGRGGATSRGATGVTSAQTSHVMPLLTHSRVTALPGLPIKGSLFHSVGFKTLFILSPQENFPVDSRRIYGLIKLVFKKAHVLQLVGSAEAEPSFPECPLVGAGGAQALHRGRKEMKGSCLLPCPAVKPLKGDKCDGRGSMREEGQLARSLPSCTQRDLWIAIRFGPAVQHTGCEHKPRWERRLGLRPRGHRCNKDRIPERPRRAWCAPPSPPPGSLEQPGLSREPLLSWGRQRDSRPA